MRKQLLLLLLLALFASCEKKTAAPPVLEFPVVEVQEQDVPIEKEYVGQVYGFKDIPIRARVEGYLKGIHFKEGRKVKKGQLLYTIDPQPFEANVARSKGELAQARVSAVRADNELGRIQPLAEINAVSKSDLDAALAEKGVSDAAVEASIANLEMAKIELGYTRIMSPIDGLIGKTLAKEGEFVGRDPNPVILNTVSQIRSIRVQFFIPESDYLRVARYSKEKGLSQGTVEAERTEDQKEDLSNLFQLILADGKVYEHRGKFDFIDREVDVETGSILIQTTFPNPDRLIRPGQFAKVKVIVDQIENGKLVPQRCVKELQGQYYVFTVDKDNKITQKQIKLGPLFKDFWVVQEGVNKGDKIILEGIQRVQEGMTIKPKLQKFESQFKPAS